MPFRSFPTSPAATVRQGGAYIKMPCGSPPKGCRTFVPLILFCLFIATFWPAPKAQGFAGKLNINTATAEASRNDLSPPPITMHHLDRFTVHDKEMRLLLDKEYFPTLIDSLANAQSEITIAMFLFKTTNSPKNRPAKILAGLVAARKRGVQVEVVLEKSSYDKKLNRENKKAARMLKNNGIRVRFDRGRVTTHTKLVVIDRRYSFIGSHNLTEAALDYNHEASLMVDNRRLAEKLLQYIKGL